MLSDVLLVFGIKVYFGIAIYTIGLLDPDDVNPVDVIAVSILAAFWPITLAFRLLVKE